MLTARRLGLLALILAVIAAGIAVWQHLRLDYVTNRGLAHADTGPGETRADRPSQYRRQPPP